MNVKFRKLIEIENLNQWFQVAPPEGGAKQWKVGRSALEMARFSLSKKFPMIINQVLEEFELHENNFICEPEALTSFEMGMGINGPRHHDLLMVGNETIVGIEAKVSEPFDKRIKEKRDGAGYNMNLRLDSCLKYLYETIPDNAENLYYQLLSATIGSIIEAKRRQKKNVVSLFIVFVGAIDAEKNYDDHVKVNDDAFKEFCNTFGLSEYGGKIPKKIPGCPDINCWLKKVKINIGDYSIQK